MAWGFPGGTVKNQPADVGDTRDAGWGKWGDDGHRVQASSYKINKLWDSKAQHGDYS